MRFKRYSDAWTVTTAIIFSFQSVTVLSSARVTVKKIHSYLSTFYCIPTGHNFFFDFDHCVSDKREKKNHWAPTSILEINWISYQYFEEFIAWACRKFVVDALKRNFTWLYGNLIITTIFQIFSRCNFTRWFCYRELLILCSKLCRNSKKKFVKIAILGAVKGTHNFNSRKLTVFDNFVYSV